MATTPAPRRVQRTRLKGQPGIPKGATYVGRGTRWGNPARIAIARDHDGRKVGWSVYDPATHRYGRTHRDQTAAHAEAVTHFETYLADRPDLADATRTRLVGKNLACWCPPGQPCHADVLLRLANPAAVSGSGPARAEDGAES